MNRALAWGYVFLPLAVLLWSGNTVVSKAALSADVPPIALAFWRWIVAIAILAPFAAGSAWRLRRTVLAHWRFFTVFGVVSVGSFNTFFYLGLERTSAVQGTLILAVLPALVVLSAWLFQGAPITRRQGAGVVVSIAGAALIVVRGDVQVLLSLTPNAGDLWCLAAVAAWTVQIVTTARIPKEVDIWSFTAIVIPIGALFIVPFYLWEIASGRVLTPTGIGLAAILYNGIAASLIAFAMWNEGVRRVGASLSGYFGNLFPVFSAAMAVLILGESLEWFHLVGGALVLAGIYFATVRRPAPPPDGSRRPINNPPSRPAG